MHRRHVIASSLAVAAAAGGAQAQAAPLLLQTAGPGSAFLPYGTGVAEFLTAAGIPVEVRESTGSLQNLSRVEDDPNSMGTAFLGSVADALAGTPAAGGRRHVRVVALFPMYETSFMVAALRASGLTSFAQLAGKRVGVGPARGPAEIFFRAAAEAAGVVPAEIVGGDPAALAADVIAGRLDALWQGAIVPIPSLVAVTTGADAVVFGLLPETVAAVTGRLPYLSPSTVPAGTYRGQDAPIATFAAWNFVVANRDLPDATAAAITRAVLGASDPAGQMHAMAAATRAENAVNNRILPFHPGAALVYAERGVALP
ncbi:TAXI family TRAP transporter solute-binding subunit [Humitalea sp. 24SJ18S-53]|uniref:TAXI family TRAP transporter solute-binding subunit n=1 Tax=Humitalea sp. 24SJ18S-53 TaxID=3422307 RepID=UPI003D671DF5